MDKIKPIFCVGVAQGDGARIQKILDAKIGNDYHVIVYFFSHAKDRLPIFNLYNVTDEKPIDFEELKTLLEKQK